MKHSNNESIKSVVIQLFINQLSSSPAIFSQDAFSKLFNYLAI